MSLMSGGLFPCARGKPGTGRLALRERSHWRTMRCRQFQAVSRILVTQSHSLSYSQHFVAAAASLALAPLLAAGLADPADIVIVAASGTSGAGRSPSAALLGTEVMGSMSAYQAGGTHRHTPEIEQALRAAAGGAEVVVSFTPALAPMPRGILATCTARLCHPGTTTGDLRDALAAAHDGEPFVRLLPEGCWPATGATVGSNAAHLQAAADAHTGRAVVVAALDNLGKGAAGQAVQAANLMLGLPETAGLSSQGVAP